MAAMSAFPGDPFAPSPIRNVKLDVYTADFRVSGTIGTRFTRVGDIVNQLTSTHLVVDQATVSEYADPAATLGPQQVLVTIAEILFVVLDEPEERDTSRADLRIPKRPVRAQIGLPPFRLSGLIHVPIGSRPVDGLLNAGDQFLPMTDATISSGPHPELARTVPALALQRSLAHLILITDDERPDELLADVIDERTAERWLQQGREPGQEG
jgi:hypothetical protein